VTEDATDGRPGPPAPPRPPAPLAIPDLDGPPAAAAVAPAADGVTDEDRTRFGLLLDRAAERGLLSTSEYQLRLGDLAEATTIDQMRQIVTELPVFNTPVTGTVAKGSRRSTAVPALGAPSPRAGGRGRSGRWVLLAIVVIAVLVSLVIFTVYAEHVVHTHGTGGVIARAEVARYLSGLRP
jgi:hypothetical protein